MKNKKCECQEASSCSCPCKGYGHRIGLFFVLLFALCFAWFYIHPTEQDLHMKLFQISFFEFDGMNLKSFLLGAIQTYVWGYIAIILWHLTGYCPIYKMLKK